MEERMLEIMRQRCIDAFKERSATRPMIRIAMSHIQCATTTDEVLEILLQVITTQDSSIEEIMNSLIDAEKRAFPKPMFVPDGHTIIGDDK